MNEYVFITRVNPAPLTQDDIATVRKGWDELVEKWKAADHYQSGTPIVKPGFVVTANQSAAGAIEEDGQRVVSFMYINAEDDAQAMELAAMVPVLPFGGSVEIRHR
ncbi:hypothetical protein [Chitinophaga sp. sic0106]|uniref:hypothetical protein n=1 Tax=Chitinophaga sp. sic0106 TaxID=2854785 RepID=UPI001C493DF1|nr:hypothetical protein [Chitinophaga sp. sic0106]MBV7532066.1 hypothetical protein [Chitinophaga sp. sic0106]